MKKLSIITINLNNVEGLRVTMNSVFCQSFSDIEYIIIDGGSKDGSAELIRENADKIDCWVSESDTGIYNAMNKGVLRATGEYVLFLNSGDYLADNDVLLFMLKELTGEELIYGNLYEGTMADGTLTVFPDILTVRYMVQYYLGHPSTFIKRCLFENDLYSEDLKIAADWEFFLKKIVVEGCSYKHVNKTVSIYNLDGLSATAVGMGDRERRLILNRLFSPIMYDEIKYLIDIEKSPFMELIPKLNKTRKFQYKMKRLVTLLLKMENLIVRRKE